MRVSFSLCRDRLVGAACRLCQVFFFFHQFFNFNRQTLVKYVNALISYASIWLPREITSRIYAANHAFNSHHLKLPHRCPYAGTVCSDFFIGVIIRPNEHILCQIRGCNVFINMLFEYAERPPPVFMTQSIHILKGGTRTHMRAHLHTSCSGLDLIKLEI